MRSTLEDDLLPIPALFQAPIVGRPEHVHVRGIGALASFDTPIEVLEHDVIEHRTKVGNSLGGERGRFQRRLAIAPGVRP